MSGGKMIAFCVSMFACASCFSSRARALSHCRARLPSLSHAHSFTNSLSHTGSLCDMTCQHARVSRERATGE